STDSELVALLDSDDLWEPTYLERMVAFLDGLPEVSIAFPDALFFGQSKYVGRRFQEVYPPSMPINFAKLAVGRSSVFIGAAIRRRVFDRVGLFDDAIWSAGDFDMWLRALHDGCAIAPVREVLVHYRRHAASMSLSGTAPIQSALDALSKWKKVRLGPEDEDAIDAA